MSAKKRQEGDSFLGKEKTRVKKHYVKTSDLTTKERKEGGKSTRERERVKEFRKIRQKPKEPEEINEEMVVAMEFSSKSKLNVKKGSTDRFQNLSTESLLSNKET